MLNPTADYYWQKYLHETDEADAEFFYIQYLQALREMPPPQPHAVVTSAKVRGAEETGPARLAQGGLADVRAPRHQGQANAA